MFQSVYAKWLSNPYFDEQTRLELGQIQADSKEIEDRFYRNLEFGTGGLRGVIGAGTNRINKYVIRQATQGLADYIRRFGQTAQDRGVVIAYDSRHFSRDFAVEAARVLATNSIKSYVFTSLRSTPELSFAVRELGAIAGIVITASHNPPQYNGYKVYWEDGGQLPPERAALVLKCIEEITDITTILPINIDEAKEKGLFQEIGEEIDSKYFSMLKSLSINPAVIKAMDKECKILYTPLHGSGNMPVRRVLSELGFKQVLVVPEQEQPDPNFPTVNYPNPEEADAFKLALKLAETENPDVIMATDPDADRIGVAVKDEGGKYRLLTGNQTGVLLTYYILSQLKLNNRLPVNGAVVKTIVTTDMTLAIAQDFGVTVDQTLTGFKFIGEKIQHYEQTGEKTFLFGFEESYGYLAGTSVRDKDAVCAAVLISEATAYYKSQGQTLYSVLNSLWQKYGYYQETLHTITLEGKSGKEKTNFLMHEIRKERFSDLAGVTVTCVEDYLTSSGLDLLSGAKYPLTLPKSDVILFRLAEGGYIVFRPSGTEPKAKIYFSVKGPSLPQAQQLLAQTKQQILSKVTQITDRF